MSGFEIDLHLPVRVFRRSPFIYTGPDYRSLILGAFSDLVNLGGLSLQRSYPLSVSRRASEGRREEQLFSLAFLYIDDDGRKRLHLTHPILLGDDEGEALETLLSGAERLGSTLGCASIDIEVHWVAGQVSFPTSLSPISYDLGKANLAGLDRELLLKRGFRIEEEIECLKADIEDFGGKAGIEERLNENITPLSITDFRAMGRRLKALPVRSYTPSMADAFFNPTENIPFYEGMAYILWGRGGWGSGERRAEGFIRWSPNLIEALERLRTPHLILFQDLLPSERYGLGKAFEWGLRTKEEGPLIQLLSAAAEAMRGWGIREIQLGFVDSRRRFLMRVLGRYGFKVVHRIELMRRAVGR